MPNQTEKHTRERIRSFYDPIEMPGGTAWKHVDVLKMISAYYTSQFLTGRFDSAGFRKYFYNVVKPPCDVASKFVELDVADINLISERPGDELKMWMMSRDLKQWMKEEEFGELLNDIARDYPKFGSVVIEKHQDGCSIVPLVNLRMETHVEKLDDSDFIYQIKSMTVRHLREQVQKGWDKDEVEKLIAQNPGKGHINIYQCLDYNKETTGKLWQRTFRGDIHNIADNAGGIKRTKESMINNENDYQPGTLLFQDETDETNLRELHWEKIPGRWLGLGFVEYLEDNQIRENELVNLKAKGLYYTSLHLFQTRDELIARNVLTEAQNGEILVSQSEIAPVATEERNLAPFTSEENRWGLNTDRKTFSFDIARGDNLPSQTPLGVARLSASMVTSYFDIKREAFGDFIKDLILRDILPSFKKQSTEEHLLKFSGSDKEMDRLRRLAVDAEIRRATWEHIQKNGTIPSPEDREFERQRVELLMKENKEMFVKLRRQFYSDVEQKADVIITGESIRSGNLIQTYVTAMQIIGTNPAILQNKSTRVAFFEMLKLSGVSPVTLELIEDSVVEQESRGLAQQPEDPGQAGSVARPVQSLAPEQVPTVSQV